MNIGEDVNIKMGFDSSNIEGTKFVLFFIDMLRCWRILEG
jgi:hypothetical protein